MSHKSRLAKLERETAATRPIYKIEFCSEAQAAALEAQRPPWQPGDRIRYIIVPDGDEPMFFACPDIGEL